MTHLWFFLSLGAAMLYGFVSPATEKLLREGLSAPFILMLCAVLTLPVYFLIQHIAGDFRENINILRTQPSLLLWLIAIGLGIIFANLLITYGIDASNASLASMIEISYPLFSVFFAWLIFREVQFNAYTLAGFILIFCGIVLIYLRGGNAIVD